MSSNKKWGLISTVIVLVVYGILIYFLPPRLPQKTGTYSLICAMGMTQSTPEVRFDSFKISKGVWVLKSADATATYTPRLGELCMATPSPSEEKVRLKDPELQGVAEGITFA